MANDFSPVQPLPQVGQAIPPANILALLGSQAPSTALGQVAQAPDATQSIPQNPGAPPGDAMSGPPSYPQKDDSLNSYQGRNNLLSALFPTVMAGAGLLLGGKHPGLGHALGGFAQGFAQSKLDTALEGKHRTHQQEDFNIRRVHDVVNEFKDLDLEAIKQLKPEDGGLPPGMLQSLQELTQKYNESLLNDKIISPKEATEILALYHNAQSALTKAKSAQKTIETQKGVLDKQGADLGAINQLKQRASAGDPAAQALLKQFEARQPRDLTGPNGEIIAEGLDPKAYNMFQNTMLRNQGAMNVAKERSRVAAITADKRLAAAEARFGAAAFNSMSRDAVNSYVQSGGDLANTAKLAEHINNYIAASPRENLGGNHIKPLPIPGTGLQGEIEAIASKLAPGGVVVKKLSDGKTHRITSLKRK